MQGVRIRSKAQWIENGEKPTKYFCGLEKRNYINKTILRLQLENDIILTDQKKILKEVENYYKTLYSNKDNCLEDIDLSELPLGEINTLSEDISQSLEGPLTRTEILNALKKMKNDKSPGSDGFTAEFLKFFWYDLSIFRGFSISRELRENSSSANKT